VRDLFSENGVYRYTGGWNVRAIVATVLGLLLAWGGYAISAIHGLTDYGWFVGFFVSGIAYLGPARARRSASAWRGRSRRSLMSDGAFQLSVNGTLMRGLALHGNLDGTAVAHMADGASPRFGSNL
jgi:Permease for cytosine/purines, uracil, thiamine, allantoin